MMTKKDINIEIHKIFDNNELDDLKRFIEKRRCLNNCNMFLIYFFHIVQSAGIMTTTIAVGYDKIYLIWLGVGLNIFASLINIYEKTNNNILKKLMVDIKAIKDGNYVDEGELIETEKEEKSPEITDIYADKTITNKSNRYNEENTNPLYDPLISSKKETKL